MNDILTICSIRIELLKMVYRHDKTVEDTVVKAKKLEDYVMSGVTKKNISRQVIPDDPV